MSVQSSLVMLPIFEFGTEAQRQRYLPRMTTMELIASYCLTEPNAGSDAGALATTIEGAVPSLPHSVDVQTSDVPCE